MTSNGIKESDATSAAAREGEARLRDVSLPTGLATTHRLSTELIDVAYEHLMHDPDASRTASFLYLELVRIAVRDPHVWVAEADLATLMDATASTVDLWCGELVWSGVAVQGRDAEGNDCVRLADAAELRQVNVTV
jgi:hypothetical protein